ncbi:restriction endonuclease subunit S [Campylobacter coli]|uniref:Restriction endonuclease subunit S n=1 Tax=Campylobacter coli TaxID=195 RepID=A0A5T2AL99_CAMCO|nr:restriction endonuclease subunit S [Campylobacter coli]EAH6714389.1 restriction endonuclease subunit S [Campylobacter coli]EAH7459842.1 restriction endonuclease subunit S [Campylobacter coli]EAH8005372.1 restriction endonuclease subunit S [Campylobacter coli]EAH8318491.1 restriction endonuclease subunit S [Campylobacter coli]
MINLLQGWEWKSLGEIFNIERGGSPRPIKEFLTDKEDGINWIKIGDIKNQKYLYKTEEKIIQEGLKKSKLVIEGDLLVSNSMSFGKPVIVKLQKGAIHDGWLLLKEKINLNKEYFYYLFSSNFMYNFLSYQASGSTVKNLNIDKLKQIEIPLPPLKEQERIVGILDESFAKIDESIKILEQDLLNLDELMQSALQKAFNPLKDNAKENYKLPQGWEWKNLGEIANTSSGGTPSRNKKEYWENGNIKWLKSGELNDGYIDFIEENITEEAIKNSSAKIFQKGTLLIAMYGATAGKLGILNLDSTTNQAICAFLHKDKNIKFLEKFLFYFLFFLRDKIIKDSFGGAQPNINQTYIKNLQIPLPPIKEQEQIASHLDELSSHVKNLKQNYQAQIKNLQELKNSLLDKAFKGRL